MNTWKFTKNNQISYDIPSDMRESFFDYIKLDTELEGIPLSIRNKIVRLYYLEKKFDEYSTPPNVLPGYEPSSDESSGSESEESSDSDDEPEEIIYNWKELEKLLWKKDNTDSTNSKHSSLLVKVLTGLGFSDLTFSKLCTCEIIKYIKQYSLSYQKSILHSFFRLYTALGEDASKTELGSYFEEINAKINDTGLSKKDKNKFEHYKDRNSDLKEVLLNNFKKNKEGTKDIAGGKLYIIQKYLLFLLYGQNVPPLRSDWLISMGVDLNSNIDNYIDSKTMIVHMNRYKNVKARGSYTFNLHDWCEEACDVMDIFITKRRDMGYPDDFLFFSKKLKRINASNANKILYDVFGAKNSCNVLRKMFSSNINNIFKGRLTKEILHEIHTIMAHTEDTSKQHYEFKEAEM